MWILHEPSGPSSVWILQSPQGLVLCGFCTSPQGLVLCGFCTSPQGLVLCGFCPSPQGLVLCEGFCTYSARALRASFRFRLQLTSAHVVGTPLEAVCHEVRAVPGQRLCHPAHGRAQVSRVGVAQVVLAREPETIQVFLRHHGQAASSLQHRSPGCGIITVSVV